MVVHTVLNLFCADCVPEFEPILYEPTNDEEVITSKKGFKQYN